MGPPNVDPQLGRSPTRDLVLRDPLRALRSDRDAAPACRNTNVQSTHRNTTTYHAETDLDASTNLVEWTTLISTNTPDGLGVYVDADSLVMPRRFYRLTPQ